MAVVCDGVGSVQDGAFTASCAVKMLGAWFDSVKDTRRLGLRLRDNVLDINRRIVLTAQKHGLQTAATLSALLLDEERYYVVHAGDSRIYCYQNSELILLTQDHVSSAGKLTMCLGRFEEIELFYNEGVAPGANFLLCSDGLYKKMDVQVLQTQFARMTPKTLRKVIENLTQYVIERGEKDNISLALVISES